MVFLYVSQRLETFEHEMVPVSPRCGHAGAPFVLYYGKDLLASIPSGLGGHPLSSWVFIAVWVSASLTNVVE